MTNFSVSDAVGAGFTLIGKRPVSVFAWGLFMIVFGVLPALAMIGPMMGPFMDMAREAQLHPGAPPSLDMFTRSYMHMMFMNPLVRLLSLVVKTMVVAAVFRAVLEPKRSSFAYLRLGMQEVWIVLVQIVEGILIFVGVLAAVLVVGLVAVTLAHFASKPAAAIVAVIGAVAGVVGLFWVLLRWSMAPVMSFEERGFRLFESWRVTKGHAFSLLLLALLLVVVLMRLELAAFAVIGVPIMIFVKPHMADHMANQAAFLDFVKQPPAVLLQTVGPVLIIGALIGSFVIGAVSAIFYAPWAAAYRMLKPEPSAG